jgi:hypothetical protein
MMAGCEMDSCASGLGQVVGSRKRGNECEILGCHGRDASRVLRGYDPVYFCHILPRIER